VTLVVAPLAAGLVAVLIATTVAHATPAAGPGPRPVSIRLRWGGGTPQAWQGRIEVVPTDVAAAPALPLVWKTLCTERDAAALAHEADGGIQIHQPRPIGSDGVEITVADWRRARLIVNLATASSDQEAARLDVPLTEILGSPAQRQLDNDGNRLTVEPAPGDALRVTLTEPNSPADPLSAPGSAVRRPGDILRFHVDPLLLVKPDEGRFELRLRLTRARGDEVIDSQVAPLEPLPEPPAPPASQAGSAAGRESTPGFQAGRVPTGFVGVDFELSLPEQAGVYEVTLEAIEQGALRWTRPLATRTLQVAAIATDPPERDADAAWEIVYELDPGSPKLHERLRRLPARGLPAVSVPTIPLPAMPLPSLSRPRMPLPRLPDVPLPTVSLPSVSGMVPRFGGLLAAGHSLAVPHELGPMLRLPAAAAGEPSWEGIVIAGARPGLPHLVEVEYPAAQRAAVVVCVLESDPSGGTVEVRHAGGFDVSPVGDTGLRRHRFVFWPTSRNPVLALANPTADPALVGRVRVSAGPRRPPPIDRRTGSGIVGTAGRPTLAMLGPVDLHRRFGGTAHVAATGGRPFADWVTHLAGIRHAADALVARGLAGSVVTIYGEGAAAWPSRLTRQAARWDPAAAGDAGLDPVTKDLLAATLAIHGREGLHVVPAFSFDAAIPSLEALLAGEDAAGIACVGGDGRPRRLPGGVHYNVLDPRVQEAVEAIVLEAAGRLAGSRAVTGLAVLLPHDGWLHLPGIAWGLDDVTFGRFLATIGGSHEATSPERFAERARLVAGPLREEWLAWRAGELAAFYGRLADRIAAIDRRWPLYVTPTTLLTAGSLADRFRPSLGAAAGGDLLREAGLVASLPADGRAGGTLVFVAPHVTAGGMSLSERSTVAAANAAVAFAATAGRRGIVVVPGTTPIDLSAIVPHGPFGTATPPPPEAVAITSDPADGDRALAESLVAADAEVVFDMRSVTGIPETVPRSRAAFESLPPAAMQLVAGLPAPLVARTAPAGGVSRIALVNAGPAAARAVLTLTGSPSAVLDATDSTPLPMSEPDTVAVPLGPWETASLAIDGGVGVAAAAIEYDEPVRAATARRIEGLRQRLAVLESPAPLDVLDNPGFELGLAEPAAPGGEPAVTGWELVEARRGALRIVPGLPATARAAAGQSSPPGRGLEFSSRNGLSTLRSNPFPPPASGRLSVAAWMRVEPGVPQPPLRIAIEGIEQGREYYRFAAVGGLAGGRPLGPEWSLFVLQVDDLPNGSVDSLRVRFDLLGPGAVGLDDVRVFDLAFDVEQRAALAKQVARIDHRFRQGDLGGALVGLEGHWPAFLETFIDDEAVVAVVRRTRPEPAAKPSPAEEPRQGMLDRLRGWWR
jgi:hypothetical protein